MYAPCAKVCLQDDRDAKTELARTVKFYNGVKVPIVGLGTAEVSGDTITNKLA